MHYQEVVRRYLSVLGASSREWALSETLVMCVELDMSAPACVRGLFFATSSSQRSKVPQFLRVTMYRVHPERDPMLLTGEWLGEPPLTQLEETNLQAANAWIEDWMAGRRASLPDSTSVVIADRLQRGVIA